MLLIVLLALVFAEETKTCDKVYMETKDDKTCGQCYGGNAVSEDKKDCVTPQSLSTGCVAAGATKDNCPTGGCADYYYQEDGKCSPGKIDNCVKYESKDKCTYCKEGYAVKYFSENKENSTCVEAKGGCLEVDPTNEKKCVLCYGEIKDDECKDDKPSITNCEVQVTDKRKDRKTYCDICKKGYYCNKADDECSSCEKVEDKIDNCERYFKQDDVVYCGLCKDGYYVKISNKTSECIENDIKHCKEQNGYVDGEDKLCELCENKYAIKDDKDGIPDEKTCVETKIEYCSNIDNNEKCYECWTGYSLTTEGKCEKCDDSNAVKCSLDGKTSYVCKEVEDVNGYANYALNSENKCEKVNNLGSIKKMSASVSMTVMLFVVLFLLF